MGYQILIADDEEKIIQLIRQLGHWKDLDIEIIAVSHNGEDALSKIERLQPDIVLTDIKMPVIDGIQMIERSKELGLKTKFIVLSGYKHFEYARSAIQLGVVDYLLKPLNEEQLNKTLQKACELVDHERQTQEGQQRLANYLERDRFDAHRLLLSYLLKEGSLQPADFPTEEIFNRRFHTNFQPGIYSCVHITTTMDSLLCGQGSLFEEKINESLTTLFQETGSYISFIEPRGIILILNYPKHNSEKIKRALSTLYYQILDLTEIYGEFNLRISVSQEKKHVAELQNAVQEAFIAEWGFLVYHGDSILEYDQIKHLPRFKVRDFFPSELEIQMVQYIKYFQFDELSQAFHTLYRRAQQYINYYTGDMQDVVSYMESTLLVIHFRESSEEERQTIRDSLYLSLKKARNFQHLIQLMYLFFEDTYRKRLRQFQEVKGIPVEIAKKYIEEHFSEAISLEEVAEKCDLAPTYLSKLFKTQTGIGFADYLIQIRIEKAKEYLIHTNESVKAISARVGYQDDKYFSKLFRRSVGIKPTEYRKLYS